MAIITRTLALFLLISTAWAGPLLHDNFDNLSQWKPLLFPKIEKHSKYSIKKKAEGSILRASSQASASGLTLKKEFDVFKTPTVKWRWKVDKVYSKGNATKKSGDDFPIRVYVLFKYNPDKASFWTKAKYKAAKILYGEYPPHSSLNFVWSNRNHSKRILDSPYTDRVKIIPLQSGKSKAGSWQEEEIDILKVYRQAFGENPPRMASLAIMNDSDNTKESAVSYMDWIEISK